MSSPWCPLLRTKKPPQWTGHSRNLKYLGLKQRVCTSVNTGYWEGASWEHIYGGSVTIETSGIREFAFPVNNCSCFLLNLPLSPTLGLITTLLPLWPTIINWPTWQRGTEIKSTRVKKQKQKSYINVKTQTSLTGRQSSKEAWTNISKTHFTYTL